MNKVILIIASIILVLAVFFYFKKQALNSAPMTDPSAPPAQVAAPVVPKATPAPIPLPASAEKLSALDRHKLEVLQEIFTTRNDNDPRMDTELTHLSPVLKRSMGVYYQKIQIEKRNERGTIVFLIAREISDQADIDFLKSVLMERPCLNLSDCSKPSAPATGEAEHLEGINELTANYPQLNAVKGMVGQYRILMGQTPPNEELANQVIAALKESTRSPNAKVVTEAENALRYLKRE